MKWYYILLFQNKEKDTTPLLANGKKMAHQDEENPDDRK